MFASAVTGDVMYNIYIYILIPCCVPEMLEYNVNLFQEIQETIKGGRSVPKLHWTSYMYVNKSTAESGCFWWLGQIIVSIYF